MKQSAIKFIVIYITFVILFMMQKPVFMLLHHHVYADSVFSDYLSVMLHGLPLDLSLAGYLTVIPGILLIVGQWCKSCVVYQIERIYYIVIAFLMSLIFCLDVALYEFWNTKLDATPLFYFFSSPSAAMASVSIWYVLGCIGIIIILAFILYSLFYIVNLRHRLDFSRRPVSLTFVLLLLTASLFIPIRGGFTVSTMNLSRVYFSQDQKLNHAAINPMFSLMYSATHQNNFGEQFRYHESEQADELFSSMIDCQATDTVPKLLNIARPDIYLIIFESFSSHLMSSLGGNYPVAKNLDSIANQGVLFTNFYANGYRTDRALPAILSAYPSQPTTSIMKDVTKTDNLPSIPRSLKDAGYKLTYYYGGDINFTNLGAYLVSAGFDKIISDKDFPISDRLSKWGVHDHLVFERCVDDVKKRDITTPELRVIQTSSSHEPFDVPYNNPAFEDIRANAFAYADSCLGAFVDSLKTLGRWDNTLLIIVPDHYGAYPKGLENPIDRHRIPLIFAGGVVPAGCRIDTIASQVDIAATLLYQMGLSHYQFVFSKNILNPASPHFAFFVDPSQFGIVSIDAEVVYNCDAEKVVYQKGESVDKWLDAGKAYLQKLYDDLDNR